MPVDAAGTVADVVVLVIGAVKRLNPGQFYEQYINACAHAMGTWIKESYGTASLDTIWDRLIQFYTVVSPEQAKLMVDNYSTPESKHSHISTIVSDKIYLYISADDVNVGPDIVKRVEEIIKPTYGPVSYIDPVGNKVTTVAPVLIGGIQYIILEKSDQNPTAISSSILQHHGFPAGPNKAAKLAHPSKQQTTKVFGETEVRLIAGSVGSDVMVELMDQANNPMSHRSALNKILEAEDPSDIEAMVDRAEIPLGGSRSIGIVNHIFKCMGMAVTSKEK